MIAVETIIDKNALDVVAKDWLVVLKKYLTTKRTGYSRFSMKVGGATKHFSTRWEKSVCAITTSDAYSKLIPNRQKKIIAQLDDYSKNLQHYVLADQTQLESIACDLRGSKKWMVKILKTEFKTLYEEFSRLYAYEFLKRLNIRTCPYCNRNYTFTISKNTPQGFSTRAELDHFYDKSTYPLLALSFYNLVPSCHTCNHSKLVAKTGVNPYFESFKSDWIVIKPEKGVPKAATAKALNVNEVLGAKSIDDFSLAISTTKADEQKNIEVFGLHELYNEHKDYVMEIIDKANAYNAVGAQNLIDAFQGIGKTPQDVMDFVWGKDNDETHFLNRPLSKLKHDVLKQIGLI